MFLEGFCETAAEHSATLEKEKKVPRARGPHPPTPTLTLLPGAAQTEFLSSGQTSREAITELDATAITALKLLLATSPSQTTLRSQIL